MTDPALPVYFIGGLWVAFAAAFAVGVARLVTR
jgi:hypothetical protein